MLMILASKYINKIFVPFASNVIYFVDIRWEDNFVNPYLVLENIKYELL